jgi:hypothetical protein
MRGVFRPSVKSKRFLRPLIGIVVAYAVAAQSLFIALGGFSLPANVGDGAPGVEICLHDAQEDAQAASELPAGNPDHTNCTHCIFCFAGSHPAVIGAAPLVFHRVDAEILVAPSTADESPLPSARAHSIASPRGPPLGA